MARFSYADAQTREKGDGNRRSQRNSVYSRPHRFRRRPALRGRQNSVNRSLAWLPTVGVVICLCALIFSACQYDVPITSGPTRNVQERLLGNWTSADGQEKLKLRKFDDSMYIVYYDGDLFRAYHSDIGEISYASVQDLDSNDRKY